MRSLDNHHVRAWTRVSNIPIPTSYSTWCPHCSEKVTFSTHAHQYDKGRNCVSASSRCPGCTEHVGIWAMGNGEPEDVEIFIYPNTGEPRSPKDVASAISEPLYRSYTSTVDAYNSGNYVATAVCCRRTLEGIFQDLIDQRGQRLSLARAITRVAESVDLAAPIRNLADVLRQGGNLGAHFNMEKEPDQRMALRMLELLENLIEFLHVLPQEISGLEDLLDQED